LNGGNGNGGGSSGSRAKFSLDTLDEGARRFVQDEAVRSGKSGDEVIAAMNVTVDKRKARMAEASRAAASPRPRPSSLPRASFRLDQLDEGARRFVHSEAQRQGISDDEALLRVNAVAAKRVSR
jgi:hypothetical protein